MYKIKYTSKFKKTLKTIQKRGKDLTKLYKIVDLLASDKKLEEKYKDHNLIGNYTNYRECHIEPDWLLVYYKDKNCLVLVLVATGSHSDLF